MSQRREGPPPRAVILGCAGPELTSLERDLFREHRPLGFILFARNVRDPAQVRCLIDSLRRCVGDCDVKLLVDQEGGRVQRLRPPFWRSAPAAKRLALLADRSLAAAAEAVRLNYRLIGLEARALGFDTVCAPVADVPVEGAHDVIGDRAFGHDPRVVARLALAAVDGLLDVGTAPVMKHLPGHGRASVDSHHAMPRVDVGRETLRVEDGLPFRALRHAAPWAMTAHVLYTDLDAERPGTVSPTVIRFIRDELGFDGVLVSDDLAMNALDGTPAERVAAALAAGCDVALYCAGDTQSNRAILETAPRLSAESAYRLRRANAMTQPRIEPEPMRWLGRLDALMGSVAA